MTWHACYMSQVGYSLGKEKVLLVSFLSFEAEGTGLEPCLPFKDTTGSFSLVPPSGSSFLPMVNRLPKETGAGESTLLELGRERTLLFSSDRKPSKLNWGFSSLDSPQNLSAKPNHPPPPNNNKFTKEKLRKRHCLKCIPLNAFYLTFHANLPNNIPQRKRHRSTFELTLEVQIITWTTIVKCSLPYWNNTICVWNVTRKVHLVYPWC